MSKTVITLDTYTEAPVDAAGLLTHQHTAEGAYVKTSRGNGELLLCGQVILYDTHQGTAPGAPQCETCARLDA